MSNADAPFLDGSTFDKFFRKMKQISQEYFNETVQSNMELFDLSLDEAIEETVDTFLIEGVDLSNIVKEMPKYKAGHPGEDLVKRLQQTELQDQEFLSTVESLKAISTQSLAHRKLLAECGLLDLLFSSVSRCISLSETSLAVRVLDLLANVITGQSHLLNTGERSKHLLVILQLLKGYLKQPQQLLNAPDQMELVRSMYVLLRQCCLENETKRQEVTGTGIIQDTTSMLTSLNFSMTTNPHLTSQCQLLHDACTFIRSMTIDDDMSVEFGQGSVNARNIASDKTVIESFVRLANDALKLESTEPISDLFHTLSAVLTREEFCCQAADFGVTDLVFNTLLNHLSNCSLTSACLALLRTLCGSDTCKRLAGSWTSTISVNNPNKTPITGPQLIISAMERYIKNPIIAKQSAFAMAAITLRQPEFAERFVSCGAPEILSKALQLHMSNSGTVRAVCVAIRNCVSRSPELRAAFVGSGCISNSSAASNREVFMEHDPFELETLLNSALKIRDSSDEAKAALRDLGCKVELKERWRGGLNSKKPSCGAEISTT
ncbi:Armadillo repeat-containing protein 6 [Fasciola hepatica]|uniref:Armadillo repeat-containing protein 6 n=1 Tax=Fasciola hepatica TaxID=6192 RepID=A0A4E0QYX0_FASHE|nr:Armadillo repeat-containing protein 6 [Fasciola hepatica]